MKPKIYFKKGRWHCKGPNGIYGVGDSPRQAYNDWAGESWLEQISW